MICIYGLKDPLRRDIKEAITKCHSAGITVRMCTGDNIDTAKAIAKDAGILSEEFDSEKAHKYSCMTGQEFEELVVGSKLIFDDEHPDGYQALENFKAF
jgi:P-type E1-E2 ATPase